MFKDLRTSDIKTIEKTAPDGIALRAAWEEVLRSFPTGIQEKETSLDVRLLSRFLGFLEGRLRVTVPASWEKSFLGMAGYSRRNLFPADLEPSPYHETELGFVCPGNMSVEKKGRDRSSALRK
jgi:hypothetical protein